jgi:hypothetical protein
MPLEFLHTRFQFHAPSRSVHMAAFSNGVPLKVIVTREVVEHIAGAKSLSQDESLTVVAQNLELVRIAADHAAERWRAHSPIVAVAPWDVITFAAQYPPKRLAARLEPQHNDKSTPATGSLVPPRHEPSRPVVVGR